MGSIFSCVVPFVMIATGPGPSVSIQHSPKPTGIRPGHQRSLKQPLHSSRQRPPLTPFPHWYAYAYQGACGAPRAAGGRSIATVAHPVDRPSHVLAVSLPSFRPSPPWASTWAILVVYAPRYREVITAMPTKAHRGAAMMRHVADIKSTHSSNDCEHHRRPLDVIMTTQPSSRRRLAEARGQW